MCLLQIAQNLERHQQLKNMTSTIFQAPLMFHYPKCILQNSDHTELTGSLSTCDVVDTVIEYFQ